LPPRDRRLLCRGLVPPRSRTRDVRSSRGWLQCWGTGKEGPRADLQSVLEGAGEDLGVSRCCRKWPGSWQGGGNVLPVINRAMAVSWEGTSPACWGRRSLSPRSILFPVARNGQRTRASSGHAEGWTPRSGRFVHIQAEFPPC
jgi:hypothetical protein